MISAITLHYREIQTHSSMALLLRHFTRLKQYFAKPTCQVSNVAYMMLKHDIIKKSGTLLWQSVDEVI